MSKRKIVRFAIHFTASVAVFGTASLLLAGFSTFAMRSSRALPLDGAMSVVDDSAETQLANRALKANRLAALLPVALTSGDQDRGLMLASASQGADLDRFYDTVTSAVPMMPAAEPEQPTAFAPAEPASLPAEPRAAVPEPKRQQAAALAAPEKPKRQPPAQPEASSMLDDGAIAGLKTRLRLSPDQAEYWPAVESALREVARTQLRHAGKKAYGAKMNIDVNSPEVQKLVWAAMPLLMRLRAEQKAEVRKLARIMGLEQVASQI